MPTDQERAERLSAVLHVLYLIFNEGYASSIGPHLQRSDLSNEAIRLTRAVHHLLPDDGEVAGLLALMLLTDARRPARTGPDGELIPLAEQDRTLWDRQAIAEGVALITDDALAEVRLARISCRPRSRPSTTKRRAPRTPTGRRSWRLYGLLKRMSDNPMVTLNHAIAAAMVHGPPAGLELLEALDADGRLAGHYRLDAVRAHLLEMAGDHRGRHRALPGGGGPDDEHSGAELPHDPGRPTRLLLAARRV